MLRDDRSPGYAAVETVRTIRIAGSEQRFDCGSQDVLLRAGLRAGLALPYECNVGSCGNCKFELVEGEVAMQWEQAPGWTEKDRQRRRFLGCQTRPLGDCTIKVRPDARYAPRHRPQRTGALLAERRAITHDIEEFSFLLDRPHLFEPGQYALLTLPGVAGPRAYSMSNVADGAADVWQFQVRRVPTGRGSQVLFDQVVPGTRLEIDGPYGMAWLRRDAPRDILCLAGGSGLAPMVSIARGASAEPALAGRRIHFLYGARTPADVCGEDMLRALPGWGPRIDYQAAVSSPGAEPWHGPVGFLHEIARDRFGERLAQMEIYFAGPPAMAAAMQQMLLAAQVPLDQVHFDQFY